MRIREHALSLVFAAAFLICLAGQSVAGLVAYNEDQAAHGAPATDWLGFVSSSAFVVDVAENWQSEYLQFFLFILGTIWLVQKGSPESKKPGDEGPGSAASQLIGVHARRESPAWARARGWRLWLFSNSLLITMGSIFLLSWLIQGIAGTTVENDERALHGEAPLGLGEYLLSADFWNRTLQNWQSELLAVGSMVGLSIYLRQRGSAESKPVGTPHDTTSKEAD